MRFFLSTTFRSRFLSCRLRNYRPSGPLVFVCKQWRHALQKATNQARSRLPIADVHYFKLLQLLRGHEKDYPQPRPDEDEYPASDGDWGE